MPDKISISRGELFSEQVDQQIQEQTALTRAQEHYDLAPITPAPPWWRTVFYHSMVYMSLCGILGGCGGWLQGEAVMAVFTTERDEFVHLVEQAQQLSSAVEKGELSQEAYEAAIGPLFEAHRDNNYLRIRLDDSLTEQQIEAAVLPFEMRDAASERTSGVLWFLVVFMTVSLLLTVAEPLISRNWYGCITQGSVGLVLGLVGSVLVLLFINQLYNVLQGGEAEVSVVRQVIARTVAWSILGAFVAMGPGVAIRHPVRCVIGLIGGLLGGAIGGFLFDVVAMLTHTGLLSRLISILAIGGFTGLGVGLLENAAKTGWVRVTGGLIAGKQFVLYRNPTLIGGSPQCEIYLFKDTAVSPRHAALHQSPVGYSLEDLNSATGILVNGKPSKKNQPLKSGDRIQIGGTELTFQTK